MQDLNLKLTFTERFYLERLMPLEDSFTNLIAMKSIDKKIGVTDEDKKAANFQMDEIKATWKRTDEPKEFDINPSEVVYLKEKLKEADDKKVLSHELIEVYSAII